MTAALEIYSDFNCTWCYFDKPAVVKLKAAYNKTALKKEGEPRCRRLGPAPGGPGLSGLKNPLEQSGSTGV